MRAVTLVCGPPCGGKTTYVAEHALDGEPVLDQDAIAQEQGSPREWLHSPHRARAANRRLKSGIRDLKASTSGRAWVIRCLASGHRRQLLAAQLQADRVVVLMPPIETVLERAASRPNPGKTAALVRRWYMAYTPNPGDVVIEG